MRLSCFSVAGTPNVWIAEGRRGQQKQVSQRVGALEKEAFRERPPEGNVTDIALPHVRSGSFDTLLLGTLEEIKQHRRHQPQDYVYGGTGRLTTFGLSKDQVRESDRK